MSSTPTKSNTTSNNKQQQRWKPSMSSEAKKLALSNEGDWKLPKGNDRMQRTRGKQSVSEPSESMDAGVVCGSENDDNSTMSSLTNETLSIDSNAMKKPPPTRVIIEANPVASMLEKHLKCPQCNSALSVQFPTRCIATSVRLECTNQNSCIYVALSVPALAEQVLVEEESVSRQRNTDYAVNVAYVLSFLGSGDGGTEAARLSGLLGLPNATHMQSRSFSAIENQMAGKLQQFADEIILMNLEKEVALVLGEATDANNNQLFHLWKKRELPREHWPVLEGVGADMGWQQRGSGRKRNSKSGHAFFIGPNKRGLIAKELCSKHCAFCKLWFTCNTVDIAPPQHQCFQNFDANEASGAMEPLAVLAMYKWLYNEQVVVGSLIVDDDSSIKAKMKWSNADYMTKTGNPYPTIVSAKTGKTVPRPDHGEVPIHMPEPMFAADPNHRRKTLASELYALAALNKTDPALDHLKKKPPKRKHSTMEWNLSMHKMDCRRLSKNYAFMIRSLKPTDSDETLLLCGKAVLEHHFNNHEYCGLWCPVLHGKKDGQQPQRNQIYRNKEDEIEGKLYVRLKGIMQRFVTVKALREVCHQMDTNANESFNNTISWLAPKNKVYCVTNSLANRIAIAIGIKSLGLETFYTLLLRKLGIEVTPDVSHFLSVKSRHQSKRIEKTKTTEWKRKRKQDEYEKLKNETEYVRKARNKRKGATYKSGIGMNDGYDEGDLKPVAKRTTKTKYNPDAKCSRCNKLGHWRPNSKLCQFYVPPKKRSKRAKTIAPAEQSVEQEAPVPIDDAAQMREELNQLETIPLSDESAFFSAALHVEDEFSDGETDVI